MTDTEVTTGKYEGPAGLVLTPTEIERVHLLSLSSNHPLDVELRSRIQRWRDSVALNFPKGEA